MRPRRPPVEPDQDKVESLFIATQDLIDGLQRNLTEVRSVADSLQSMRDPESDEET